MDSSKILIVDHHIPTTKDLQAKLSQLGYEVVGVAETRAHAIDKSINLQPDLILMNTNLRTIFEGLKTDVFIHSTIDMPIVYYSNQAGQETIRQLRGTEPLGFIISPFNKSQLFATIEIALQRHKLETQLQESKQWLNGVLMGIKEGVVATDVTGTIRFINSTALTIIGYKDETNIVGRNLSEILFLRDEISGEPLDLFGDSLDFQNINEKKDDKEALLISSDGKNIPVGIRSNSIIKINKLQGMVFVFRDITRHRRAIAEIRKQANRTEALAKIAEKINSQFHINEILDTVCNFTNQILGTSATMVFLYDVKSNLFKERARKFDSDFKYTEKTLGLITFTREALEELLPSDNLAFSITNPYKNKIFPFRHFIRLAKIQTVAIAPLVRNGNIFGILICGTSESDKSYSKYDLEMFKGLADDVTLALTNARLFDQVRRGRERQRQLSMSLVAAQEIDRRNIARELHDHLGQELTGLQFMIEACKPHIDDTQKYQLEEVQKTVSSIIRSVRDMSLELRPSMLDDLGLLPTLEWHFERYTNQTGIKVDFHNNNYVSRLPIEIEITIYRIIQESLTNVARYARVKEVLVGLVRRETKVWVEILDHGQGFDYSESLDRPTAGLGGMRERADLAGGYLKVNSYIGQGTQILATLPIRNEPLERRKDDRDNSRR